MARKVINGMWKFMAIAMLFSTIGSMLTLKTLADADAGFDWEDTDDSDEHDEI